MKQTFAFLFFILLYSLVYATEITLKPGSNTVIKAGDTATVSCEGHSGSGCDCKIEVNSGGDICGYLMWGDTKILGTGCYNNWNSNASLSALNSCKQELKETAACK